MSEGGLFSGSPENVVGWMRVVGLLLIGVAAGLIVLVLVRKPEWRITSAARWTLLIGLFLLPSVSMLLGNVVGFHNVKQSCSECHVMNPWVSDMKDPKSATLAAKHFQNRWINEDQCYTCHTGYGLAGNVQAKLGGLSHVWHEYVAGIPPVIKIKRPFPVETCLHCHAGAASYEKIDQHVAPEFKPKIVSGEMSCFECHTAPHPVKKP